MQFHWTAEREQARAAEREKKMQDTLFEIGSEYGGSSGDDPAADATPHMSVDMLE